MAKFQKYIDIGFLLALLFIPFVPHLGRLDIIGPQFLYLSILLLSYTTIKFLSKQKFQFQLNYSTSFYLLFLIIALLSTLNSLNVTESIIELTRYFIIFIILFFSYSIINNKRTYIDGAIFALVGFLFIETCYILIIFFENYSFDSPPTRIREFQGLAYNQNIASNSILVKIPLALFIFIKTKNRLIKYLLGALIAISVFDILIIGSRSAIIGIYALLIFLIIFLLFLKKLKLFSVNRKNLLKPIVIILSVFILQNYLYINSKENLQAVNRSIELNDSSSNTRLMLWKSSIEMIKDFPLLGIGIGNWKVVSIKYVKNNMQLYNVPKHTHNDFIQMFSETGIIGGLFYLLFFISPLYFLLKNYTNFSSKEKELSLFLTFSLFCIGIDSFFNFPKSRPYSLLNLFWVITFIYNLKQNKTNDSPKLRSSLMYILFLSGIIFSVYISNRVYNSLKEQVPLIFEFNNYPNQIITPVSEILPFEDEIPNLSNLVIPIKFFKARYLFLEGKYDAAKKLIKEGRKSNPFMGYGDVLLNKIYTAENKLDSAIFYGKRSIEKLPQNESHITHYQITLDKARDLEEIERIFLDSYDVASNANKMVGRSEAIWQNYLISIAKIKLERGIDFSENERKYVKEGQKLFPQNKIITSAEKIINYGGDMILIANEFDSKGIKYFQEKDYVKAINNWKKAIDIIPNDEAYYLNIAHSYISMDEIKNAQKYFNLIEAENLRGISGKFEFLKAINNLKQNKITQACDLAKKAKNLGYDDAKLILNEYKCYNN